MQTYRALTKRDSLQKAEPAGGSLQPISAHEFLHCLNTRKKGDRLDLRRLLIGDLDLSGRDLSNIDFSCTRFERVDLTRADMDKDDVSRCFFIDCRMHGVRLTNADASDASFRGLDLSGADFRGTDFYYAALESANLSDVITDSRTKWFGDAVPREGAFIGWKVGANSRVIQLLVPAGARRACATSEAGRAEYAKVLSITSPDRSINYSWETAMVDHDFFYKVGKTVYAANGFSGYEWLDDAPGLHFFMDREMAIAFGTGNY